MSFWAWWRIRETKGLPIKEMDKLFGAEYSESIDSDKLGDEQFDISETKEKNGTMFTYVERVQ
ncbi:hypothetical protein BDZ85DRAFT_279103 [Elsinoe ampelina]|uniref:Uncharacterized protein n=1 Tax=Elsinoe ampelina TaxID=302913 RepID=A0A6A6GI57_9PEZI|nr:hypothetical protein BDZ85DRAFT_279103 [Elsinoe ampelina]